MTDENNNVENNQEENQNKCEDKKSCWVKIQPTDLKIQEFNDKGATLLNNKQPIEAKKYIDIAYKLLFDNKFDNLNLYSTVILNKVAIEREFKNFNNAKILIRKLICKLEDYFPSEQLVKAKILSATIKVDLKDFDEAITEFIECISTIKFLETKYAISYEIKAELYNNLAMTYSFIGKLSEALDYYNKALDIYECNKNAAKYKFYKADTLNNVGIMYQNFNMHKDAIKYFEQALKLHDNEYYIAMVCNNLSNSYRKLGVFDYAIKFRKQSINIRETLYLKNNVYADNYADELNNYGNLLNDLQCYNEAIASFLKSLEIFSNLSKSSPEKYGEKVASTSANIAGSYCYIKEYDKAKGYCNEALKFFKKNYQINSVAYATQICGIFANLSIIDYKTGNIDGAEEDFYKAFEYLNVIKTELRDNNQSYFYSYKSRVEKNLDLLINLNINNPDKLLMIIENKRNEDFIYNKKYKIDSKIKCIKNEVLITIELTYSNCIFILTTKNGNKIFTIKNEEFIDKCNALLFHIDKICNKNEIKNDTHAFLLKLGNDIFNLLPEDIKECFYNNKNKIFLSLDQSFMNFPFEFLAYGEEFIGKDYLLPRVNGFNMFIDIIKSCPKTKFQNKKLLILGYDKKLGGAKSEYNNLLHKKELKGSIALSRTDASSANIAKNMDKSIALFHFCGHGYEPDVLLLNFAKDRIDSKFFENYTFENNPLFFINCCLSGTIEYFGGGKFKGLSSTLYKRGAKAIISCTYSIYDKSSKSFSVDFYEHFLQGNSIEDSVMFARSKQKMPWEWGLHYCYGNPYLQIDTNKLNIL